MLSSESVFLEWQTCENLTLFWYTNLQGELNKLTRNGAHFKHREKSGKSWAIINAREKSWRWLPAVLPLISWLHSVFWGSHLVWSKHTKLFQRTWFIAGHTHADVWKYISGIETHIRLFVCIKIIQNFK